MTQDIVERLLFRADVGDKGREPDPNCTLRLAAATITELREALTLAANRMDVMALAVIHESSERRYEWHEWAVETRAAREGRSDG